jgi:hypothetical protein
MWKHVRYELMIGVLSSASCAGATHPLCPCPTSPSRRIRGTLATKTATRPRNYCHSVRAASLKNKTVYYYDAPHVRKWIK